MRKDNGAGRDLDDIIHFDVDTSEISLCPGATQDLFNFMAKYTKSTKVNYSKIRQESRARVKLNTQMSYFPEVFSVSKNLVKSWTRSLGFTIVPGLYSDFDLEKNKYEGGFKVWEGTCDLIKFLTEDDDVMKNFIDRERTLRVLELGAGSGLASLSLISRLVCNPDFKAEFIVHLQDYNWEVLSFLTLTNFAVNLPRSYLEALLEARDLRFFYGEWANFRAGKRRANYDLIMMSEVIYNSDNYESLHNLLRRHLRKTGYVIMATKDSYFGLSGGLYSWLDYLESKGKFHVYKLIKVPNTSIPRSILILNRKSLNV